MAHQKIKPNQLIQNSMRYAFNRLQSRLPVPNAIPILMRSGLNHVKTPEMMKKLQDCEHRLKMHPCPVPLSNTPLSKNKTPDRQKQARGLGIITLVLTVFCAQLSLAEMTHGLSLNAPLRLAANQPLPYADPTAPSGGRMTFGAQGTFDTLNPFVVRGISAQGIASPMGLVIQSLMLRSADEPFALYGGLAKGVELAPDHRAITFFLEPEARFSDGQPVTAQDVYFSWSLLKEKGRPNYRGYYSKVTSASVIDPFTIRFEFEADDRELPLILGLMPVLPAHQTNSAQFEETTLTPPMGSGPYLVTEVKPGETVTFQKNPNFWGRHKMIYRGLYHPDVIRYDYYRDSNTLFEAFKGGLVDLRIEDNPTRWATAYDFPAMRDGRMMRESIPIGISKGMNGFVFNTRKAVFKEKAIREALNDMLDFDWINSRLFNTLYRRSDSYFTGSPLASTGTPANARERALLAPFIDAINPDILEGRWHPTALDGTGRDRRGAQKALARLSEAGYRLEDGVLKNPRQEPVQFEILVNSRLQEKLALHFAQSLQRIGVRASVRLIDEIQYWRRLAAFDFDMIQALYAGTPSPGNEQYHRWGSLAAQRQGSLNYAGAQDPAIDAMIEAMLKAQTSDDYLAAVHALDRVLLSGFYVVPLFHAPDLWLARKATIGRPTTTPLFGTAPETFWVRPDTQAKP